MWAQEKKSNSQVLAVLQEQLVTPGSLLTSLVTSPVGQVWGFLVPHSHFHHEIAVTVSQMFGRYWWLSGLKVAFQHIWNVFFSAWQGQQMAVKYIYYSVSSGLDNPTDWTLFFYQYPDVDKLVTEPPPLVSVQGKNSSLFIKSAIVLVYRNSSPLTL